MKIMLGSFMLLATLFFSWAITILGLNPVAYIFPVTLGLAGLSVVLKGITEIKKSTEVILLNSILTALKDIDNNFVPHG